MNFETKLYSDPEKAAEYIYDYLNFSDWFSNCNCSITYSSSKNDFICERCATNEIYPKMVDFLRDLDSQEGIIDNEQDFCENNTAQDWIYNNWGKHTEDTLIQYAGDGICVIRNNFAIASTEFPFIIVKSRVLQQSGYLENLYSILKNFKNGDEYTTLIIPAVYIEFC